MKATENLGDEVREITPSLPLLSPSHTFPFLFLRILSFNPPHPSSFPCPWPERSPDHQRIFWTFWLLKTRPIITALVILRVYYQDMYYNLPNVHQPMQSFLPAEVGSSSTDRPDGGHGSTRQFTLCTEWAARWRPSTLQHCRPRPTRRTKILQCRFACMQIGLLTRVSKK